MNTCKTKVKNERRRSERYSAKITLDLSKSKGLNKNIQASVTDISQGGMAFEMSRKLDVGSFLSLGLAPFRVYGDIAYCKVRGKSYHYGLRFHRVHASPAVSRLLRLKGKA